jgi:CorA-like Mg2+ transporter protein
MKTQFYTDSREGMGESAPITLQTYPFQGGFEDFLELPAPGPIDERPGPWRPSMFDDISRYWTAKSPPGFDPACPSLISLSYYSLRLAVAESRSHADLLRYITEDYEYAIEKLLFSITDMDRLENFFRLLQVWRRRSSCDTMSLGAAVRFLKESYQRDTDHTSSDLALTTIIRCYEDVASQIDHFRHRLETMSPVVASLVQILDSRRSFDETTHISRLTYLALVFVPLTYISSLFGMEGRFAPGQRGFWWYFVAAIPVLVLVFLIARPPTKTIGLMGRINKMRRDQLTKSENKLC